MFFYTFWDSIDKDFNIFGIILYLVQNTSYTYTFLKNPGIPKQKSEKIKIKGKILYEGKNKDFEYCSICNILNHKKNKVSHCEDCNVCIEGNYIF